MVNDLRGVRYYRPTVYDVVKSKGFPSDVNPVGRLDNATDGIMLFTDDSELAAAVRNPPKSALEAASEWKRKEYVLVLLASPKHALDKNRSPADLELLERSMEQPLEFSHHGRRFVTGEVSKTIVRIERVYQDLNYAPSRAVGHPSGVHQALGWCLQCRVTLSEGKHHQIRRIASRAKFIVLSLTRARICSVLSVDSVPCPGDCRWLSQGELEVIRQGLGLKERPAAESGEQATEEEEG
jgi:pseudouridine synthase